MDTRLQAALLWIVAVVITLASVFYQRATGPTYPVEDSLTHNVNRDTGEETKIDYSLLTSEDTGVDAQIVLVVEGAPIQAQLKWKRFKSHDDWTYSEFEYSEGSAINSLPSQPPAGKIIYAVEVRFVDGSRQWLTPEPVTIRFKGSVPAFVLVPHILFMFISMLLSTRTGLAALVRSEATIRYAWITFITLLLGGMLLGPIVQKYAFDAYWTGWPFGHDLTDNKTLAAVIAWILALWRFSRTGNARGWFLAAAIVQLAVYLIPHSVLGSELDYTQMEQ